MAENTHEQWLTERKDVQISVSSSKERGDGDKALGCRTSGDSVYLIE
jgi:hypothetical protein